MAFHYVKAVISPRIHFLTKRLTLKPPFAERWRHEMITLIEAAGAASGSIGLSSSSAAAASSAEVLAQLSSQGGTLTMLHYKAEEQFTKI
jgi:hypothetical protein